MNRIAMMGLAGAVAIFGSACGDVDDQELETLETQEGAIETDVSPETDMTAADAAAALAVDSLPGVGPYLTDGAGRALYLIEGAPSDSSICYDECAEEWPPFLAEQGTPTAGAAPVQRNLIGTIEREDGSTQVTYAGHALYYYHDDAGPGQTTGQDVTDEWGEWYLVRPSGEHLEGQAGNGAGGGAASGAAGTQT